MVFSIPANKFAEDLGASVLGATQKVTEGYTKRKEREFARNKSTNYSEFLINSLDIPSDSPTADALRTEKDMNTLSQMGKLLQKKKASETPLQQRKEERLQRDDVGTQYQRVIKDVQDNVKSGLISESDGKKTIGSLRQEEHKNYDHLKNNREMETGALQGYFDSFIEKEEEKKPSIFSKIKNWMSGKDADSQQQQEQAQQQQAIAEQQQQAEAQQQQQAAIQQQQSQAQQEQEQPPELTEDQKQVFDQNNPEHIQARDAILEKAQGNREIANQLLGKFFKL